MKGQSLEQSGGWLICYGYHGIQLMQVQATGIIAQQCHGFQADMFTLMLRQDEQAYFGTQMNGIKVCQVGQPDGFTALFDDQTHLSVGKQIILR